MPLIAVNGQAIHYAHNQKEGGLALVLVHGAGGRIQSWPLAWQESRYLPSVSGKRWLTDFPIYILDLPGHGRSHPPGRTTINHYAADVLAFTQAIGLSQVVLVGHSMGGAIAQQAAAQRPSNLSALILISTGPQMPVTNLILDGLLQDFPQTVDLINRFSWHKTAAPLFTAVARQQLLSTDPHIIHGDFIACHNFDSRPYLNQINLPTLIISGDSDKMMPPANSQFLATHIPQAQLSLIANAGHYPMIEKTASVAQAIVKFLKSKLGVGDGDS